MLLMIKNCKCSDCQNDVIPNWGSHLVKQNLAIISTVSSVSSLVAYCLFPIIFVSFYLELWKVDFLLILLAVSSNLSLYDFIMFNVGGILMKHCQWNIGQLRKCRHYGTVLQPQNESSYEILSHWHPNLTINLIDDHTHWVRGMIPSPLDECKYCWITFISVAVGRGDKWGQLRTSLPQPPYV